MELVSLVCYISSMANIEAMNLGINLLHIIA
jgi:hypothetical protein